MTNVSRDKLIELADHLYDEQNLLAATLLGLISVIITASLWGMFGYIAGLSVDFLSVIIGPFIGFIIKESGKGIDYRFALLAIIFSTTAIVLGKMMVGAVEGAIYYDLTPWEVFFSQTFEQRWSQYIHQLQISDIVMLITGVTLSANYCFRGLSDLQISAIEIRRVFKN